MIDDWVSGMIVRAKHKLFCASYPAVKDSTSVPKHVKGKIIRVATTRSGTILYVEILEGESVGQIKCTASPSWEKIPVDPVSSLTKPIQLVIGQKVFGDLGVIYDIGKDCRPDGSVTNRKLEEDGVIIKFGGGYKIAMYISDLINPLKEAP